MLHKSSLIALTFLFVLFATGCPEGGINTNNNDAGPPQRDADAEATPDVDVDPCGDGVCSAADNEDCTTCEEDCFGITCSPVRELTVQQYRDDHMDVTGETVVDLRALIECENARIPGDNFCSELSDWWDGTEITNSSFLDSVTMTQFQPLVLYGGGSDDATVIAVGEAAWALGYIDVYRITGGIDAWRAEGWFQDVSYEGIERLYYPPTADVYLIDTMDATHYDECHIQDAVHLDTAEFYYGGALVNGGQALLDMAPDTINDVLIFFCVNEACEYSKEASIAAEILGYEQILHYKGGTEEWFCGSSPTAGTDCAGAILCQ